MKKTYICFLFVIIYFTINNTATFAQSLKEVNNYRLYIFSNGQASISESAEIYEGDKRVFIYIKMTDLNNNKLLSIDTCISETNTLAPIYHSSFAVNNEYVLHYSKQNVTGYYLDKINNTNSTINDPINVPLIDSYCLEYMLTTLPLAPGFKKSFNTYGYSLYNRSNISKVSIDDVESDVYASKQLGNRDVWKVSLTTTTNGVQDKSFYCIDKETRKILKSFDENDGTNILGLNSEDDFNPYHSKFDKEATLKLLTGGKSVISGQAFVRGDFRNLESKKLAQKGTPVQLIPYTDFYKEWFEANEKASRTGQSAPLPKDAAECIKTTEISDNKGHFEFTNLMPGDYLLLVNFFTFKHLSHEKKIYSDEYNGYGNYVGTVQTGLRSVNDGIGTGSASVRKIVTIKQDGQKVTVKLNQTK